MARSLFRMYVLLALWGGASGILVEEANGIPDFIADPDAIDKDCPGGPLCVEFGSDYLRKKTFYNDAYALKRAKWCEENGIHYKVWADISNSLYGRKRALKGPAKDLFTEWDRAGAVLGGGGFGGDNADELTLRILENQIPTELLAKNLRILGDQNFRLNSPISDGGWKWGPMLTKRCIDMNTFVAYFIAKKQHYSFDTAVRKAFEEVESLSNTHCLMSNFTAQMNCKFAQVQCEKAGPGGNSTEGDSINAGDNTTTCGNITAGSNIMKLSKDLVAQEQELTDKLGEVIGARLLDTVRVKHTCCEVALSTEMAKCEGEGCTMHIWLPESYCNLEYLGGDQFSGVRALDSVTSKDSCLTSR